MPDNTVFDLYFGQRPLETEPADVLPPPRSIPGQPRNSDALEHRTTGQRRSHHRRHERYSCQVWPFRGSAPTTSPAPWATSSSDGLWKPEAPCGWSVPGASSSHPSPSATVSASTVETASTRRASTAAGGVPRVNAWAASGAVRASTCGSRRHPHAPSRPARRRPRSQPPDVVRCHGDRIPPRGRGRGVRGRHGRGRR